MSTASRRVPAAAEADEARGASGADPTRARQSASRSQRDWGSRPSRTRSTAHLCQSAGQSATTELARRGIAHVTAPSPVTPSGVEPGDAAAPSQSRTGVLEPSRRCAPARRQTPPRHPGERNGGESARWIRSDAAPDP